MLNTRDTRTTAREITDTELDFVSGGITKETLALTAVCLLSPAFLLGFSSVVAVRTLTE